MLHIPHLETDVTQACQLSCVGCNHSVPLWRSVKGGPWAANAGQVYDDLNQLSSLLHADRWGALGGEPLLHKDLVGVLHAAEDTGIADVYEVWTNGLLLRRQSPEFWRSFNVLVLSVYAGKHDEASLTWIQEKCASERVELVVKDETRHPNFKTMLESVPTDAKATKAKFASCFFRSFSRVANFGYFFTCCCAPHLPMLVQGQTFGTDGIEIAGLTEERLRAYLERTDPLGACSICAGRETAKPLTWREERNPAKWLAASAGQ